MAEAKTAGDVLLAEALTDANNPDRWGIYTDWLEDNKRFDEADFITLALDYARLTVDLRQIYDSRGNCTSNEEAFRIVGELQETYRRLRPLRDKVSSCLWSLAGCGWKAKK